MTIMVRVYASAALTFFIIAVSISAPLKARAAASESEFSAGVPGDPAKPARIIYVSMFEKDEAMAFSPALIEVQVGEQVRFVIKNDGEQPHEFHLASFDENAHDKIEMEKNPSMRHDGPNSQSVEPGKQAEILWKFSVPGDYEFACFIPGHYGAGMHGRVIVK